MIIKVKVIPNSKKQKIEISGENELKINLKSKPERGKANQELVKTISDFFNAKESNIKIIKGKKSQRKIIKIN